jgi:ABC-type uncharacterized transport system permease subunit
MFTALSFAIARRCGIINLGAEGQFKIGALAATLVGVNFQGLPIWIHLPMALAAGFLGGAFYGLIVGLLKIRFGASELITTIMLNYVASQILDFSVNGPMKDSASSSYPQSAQMFDSAIMPKLFGGTSRLHWGLVLVIVMIVFYYFFLWKTTKGFQMRVVGLNPSAGAYAGMSIQKSSLLSMFLAGGFAGLGGCVVAFLMQYLSATWHYPITVAGRPLNSWPAFVPLMFELTVLAASLTALVVMVGLNGLPRPHHPLFGNERFERATRDRFFLCIEARDPRFERQQTRQFLEELGPLSVSEVPQGEEA